MKIVPLFFQYSGGAFVEFYHYLRTRVGKAAKVKELVK